MRISEGEEERTIEEEEVGERERERENGERKEFMERRREEGI